MKAIALFLLLAGWMLVLSALALLHSPLPEDVFMLAGTAVELLGVALLFRAHLRPPEEAR